MINNFKGKNVLVLGLGLLGGGVATTKWLLDRGAQVTVSDLKDAALLSASVRQVENHLKKSARDGADFKDRRTRLTWALGGHSDELVRANDVLVVGPDVPLSSPYVQLAYRSGKTVINEAGIFYGLWKGPTVGVTGTRGKTTTAAWCGHLLNGAVKAVVTGNSATNPLLSSLDGGTKRMTAVTELSSFMLEHFQAAPDIAVITNLYRDHLNRHGTMEEYARTKSNIFKRQTADGKLILNADDAWTPRFLEAKPAAAVWQFSERPLPGGQGLYLDRGWAWFLSGGAARRVIDLEGFAGLHGAHNMRNFLGASLAAHLAGCPWDVIVKRVASLPQVPYRQEVVHKSGRLTIINDTCATSPEGGIAALERFGGPNCVLVCGGTDRDLDYRDWSKALVRFIAPENTIFLAGSATDKMRKALKRSALGRRSYDTLGQCLEAALVRAGKFVNATVLFSPAAKSFEKFRNEFDRGQQFNALVKRVPRRT